MGEPEPDPRRRSTDPSLIPFIIGVTGHRDLEEDDDGWVAAHVEDFIRDRLKHYPRTPIVLLSPLAEGADRLVARVCTDLGIRLVVPLPLPRDLYEQDFATEESRDEFDDLLRRAEQVVPMRVIERNDADALRPHGHARERQYQEVGAWIVRNAQLVIALWDGGSDDPRPGGTAQVVSWQLNGLPPELAPRRSPLDVAGGGPVFHVPVCRKGHAPVPDVGSMPAWRYPNVPEESSLLSEAIERARAAEQAIWDGFEQFNEDVAGIGTRVGVESDTVPAERLADLTPYERAMLDRHKDVDALAMFFQTAVTGTTRKIFVAAFLAIVFFEIFAHLHEGYDGRWTWIALYLAAFVAAFGWYREAQRRDYERKYLDYRALAEGLRVQLFWRIAKLEGQPSDHYLRLQRNALDWIRDALLSRNLTPAPGVMLDAEQGPPTLDHLGLVASWIDRQSTYFAKRATQNKLVGEWLRWSSAVLIGCGFLLALSMLTIVGPRLGAVELRPIDSRALAMLAILVVTGAAVRALGERALWKEPLKPATKRFAERCRRLARPFLAVGVAAGISFGAAACWDPTIGPSVCVRHCLLWTAAVGVVAALASAMRAYKGEREVAVATVASLATGMACCMIVAAIFAHVIPVEVEPGNDLPHCVHWLIAATVLVFLLGALLRAYGEVRAYESEAKRYEVMATIFGRAQRQVGDSLNRRDVHGASEVINDLAQEALIENGDWLLIHRDRPLQVPTGG